MDIVLSAIGTGLAGKNNDFFLGPILVPRPNGQCGALKAVRFGHGLVPCADFPLHEEVSAGLTCFGGIKRTKTNKMPILGPDTIGNDEFLHADVHKARFLEPLLELDPRTGFVASLVERAVEFVVAPENRSVVETAVF